MKKLIFILGITLFIMKVADLTPKMSVLPAEQELITPYISGERPLGENIGGLQMYSNVFKRGYGDNVFGSDENGIWLGAADYADGKFKVSMAGETEMKSATFKDENDTTFIDADGLVSSANFKFGTVVLSSQITRTASGWGDASGLSLTFTLPREAYVLIIASLSGKNTSLTSSGGEQFVRFDINGTPTGVWNLHGVPGGAGLEAVSATIHYIALLPAGSNTIKVQHRWSVLGDAILLGSTGTEYAGSRLSYLILGN